MNTNADITVFNRWYNKETRLDEWHRTQIPGVSWYGGQAVTVGDKGLQSADLYKVRIPLSSAPEGKTFLRPEEYAAKTKADLSGFWTLQNGDCISHGLLDSDITQPKELTGEHFLITGWGDNRRGTPAVQHWKAEGK